MPGMVWVLTWQRNRWRGGAHRKLFQGVEPRPTAEAVDGKSHTSHATRHTSHVTLFLQVTDAMLIHGGYGVNATEFFTDLWLYDFSGSRWIMLYCP